MRSLTKVKWPLTTHRSRRINPSLHFNKIQIFINRDATKALERGQSLPVAKLRGQSSPPLRLVEQHTPFGSRLFGRNVSGFLVIYPRSSPTMMSTSRFLSVDHSCSDRFLTNSYVGGSPSQFDCTFMSRLSIGVSSPEVESVKPLLDRKE